LAVRPCPEVDLKARRVMGVTVPALSIKDPRRPLSARGYGIVGTSPVVDQVSGGFENALRWVTQWAESEAVVRRLAVEVEKTKRRERALDEIIIPRLVESVKYIEFYLEEREREDLFRLKRIRERTERGSYALTP
jgi:V/A-type H+-transporting ATPase subunit D